MADTPKLRFSRPVRYLLVILGWLLCAYEWVRVWRWTPRREEATLFYVLIPAILVIHGCMYLWVAHSKRLAARGKRGRVTRYTPPQFSRDHLGRQIILDASSRLSREIEISIEGDCKRYTATDQVRVAAQVAATTEVLG